MTEPIISYHYDPDLKEIIAKNEKGEKVGEIEFHGTKDYWTVDHTGVKPEYRGGTIARDLVSNLVQEAREAGVKLGATCSYAKHVLESTEDYKDLYSPE